MNARLLIDALMRQTTVLIAQVSTAAGIRAPLTHVADQVFLELSRELESQGLSRKVVADMFGMALRGYQRKIQRLEESATVRDRTLWEALLEHIREHDGVHRRDLLTRFIRDDADLVGSVMRDLVHSGLVFVSGGGPNTLYRATSAEELVRLFDVDSRESLSTMLWAVVYHSPGSSVSELSQTLKVAEDELRAVATALVAEGRLQADDPVALAGLKARALVLPVGAEFGWEAAVFDHFQAVAGAIAAKLRSGARRADRSDVIGGATLHFDVAPDHPLAAEVHELLERVRSDVNALWNRVVAHNEQHPIPEDRLVRVCFYFGQNVVTAAGT